MQLLPSWHLRAGRKKRHFHPSYVGLKGTGKQVGTKTMAAWGLAQHGIVVCLRVGNAASLSRTELVKKPGLFWETVKFDLHKLRGFCWNSKQGMDKDVQRQAIPATGLLWRLGFVTFLITLHYTKLCQQVGKYRKQILEANGPQMSTPPLHKLKIIYNIAKLKR